MRVQGNWYCVFELRYERFSIKHFIAPDKTNLLTAIFRFHSFFPHHDKHSCVCVCVRRKTLELLFQVENINKTENNFGTSRSPPSLSSSSPFPISVDYWKLKDQQFHRVPKCKYPSHQVSFQLRPLFLRTDFSASPHLKFSILISKRNCQLLNVMSQMELYIKGCCDKFLTLLSRTYI